MEIRPTAVLLLLAVCSHVVSPLSLNLPFLEDVCNLPKDPGTITDGALDYFFHNSTSKTCELFQWGGSEGNANKFETWTECQRACIGIEDVCNQRIDAYCWSAHTPRRYFYNSMSKSCEVYEKDKCDRNANNFDTASECQRACMGRVEVCSQAPDPGQCEIRSTRYFYNAKVGACQRFTYNGCEGNANNFATEAHCHQSCVGEKSLCDLPRDKSQGRVALPKFFHNKLSGKCEQIVYRGSYGNDNWFYTKGKCQADCVNRGICVLPKHKGSCVNPRFESRRYTKFYYNTATGKCEQFDYNGCIGNANNFDTLGECQEVCE
ncbi:hypothetical protein ACOMHN_060046 [Nucella lapillus]